MSARGDPSTVVRRRSRAIAALRSGDDQTAGRIDDTTPTGRARLRLPRTENP